MWVQRGVWLLWDIWRWRRQARDWRLPWTSARGRCHKKSHWRIAVIWLPSPPLPVSADLEKGFGDSPQSCGQTIQAAAATGLVGGSIEDHTAEKSDSIYSFDLAVARIGAACVARDALRKFSLGTTGFERYHTPVASL